MKIRNTFLILSGLFVLFSLSYAKTPQTLVKKGNQHVEQGALDSALVKYYEAATDMDSIRAEIPYNIGGVYARRGNPDDALKADSLFRAVPPTAPTELRANAAYNSGKSLAEAQQYDKAVQSFIESLRLDPDDMDTKRNLELALRQLQQQQQQQQQNQDQNQDQENKDDQQQQQQQQNQDQEQKQDEQQQQQQQNQEQQDQEQQEQQQQQEMDQEKMDEKMAERFLDRLQEDEKELLKKVIRQQVPEKKKNSKKAW